MFSKFFPNSSSLAARAAIASAALAAFAGLAVGPFGVQSLRAATILPANNSFELPALPANSYATSANSGLATDWNWATGGVAPTQWLMSDQNNSRVTSGKDGARYMRITSAASTPSVGVIYQTLATTVASNTQYSLSVNVGIDNDYSGGTRSPGATIELDAWDPNTSTQTTLTNLAISATAINNAAGTLVTYTTPSWDSTLNPSIVGQELHVGLIFQSTTSGNWQDAFDNVQITATSVPDTATLGLMAVGGLGLLVLGKRRKMA